MLITVWAPMEVTRRSRDGYVMVMWQYRLQRGHKRSQEITEKSHKGHITITGYRLQVTDHKMIKTNYCSYSSFDFINYYMVDYVITSFIVYYNNSKKLLKNQNLIRLSTNFEIKKISLNFYLCKNLKAVRYII